MARYSIDGQILTDIADAVRSHTGAYIIETDNWDNKELTFREINATDNVWHYTLPSNVYSVRVDVLSVGSDEGEEVKFFTTYGSGKLSSYSAAMNSSYSRPTEYSSTGTFPMTIYEDNNVSGLYSKDFTFGMRDGDGATKPLAKTMTVVVSAFDVNGETLGEQDISNFKAITPGQMADKISDMCIVPDEALNITGDCYHRFYWGHHLWLINQYGDRITTKDLTNISHMFDYCQKLKDIPFELNCKATENINMTSLFDTCENLTEIPKINNAKPSDMSEMFSCCYKLRYLPEDIETWFDWSYIDNATGSYNGGKRGNGTFSSCYSLRSVPMGFLNHNNPYTTTSSGLFYSLFSNCYTLNEIIGLPIFGAEKMKWTSNCFYGTVSNCSRLKDFTFATNPDGSPIQVNWSKQTIDLSSNVGYATSSTEWYLVDYGGCSKDKKMTTDTTYQNLKDDPECYTIDLAYSRYNHDSAVRTINSLPDTTSSGGTNTIKFKGAAGSGTDGGAINTLTAEEIAVATAKGWTVSLV